VFLFSVLDGNYKNCFRLLVVQCIVIIRRHKAKSSTQNINKMVWWESKYCTTRRINIGYTESTFINLDTVGGVYTYSEPGSLKKIILYNKYTGNKTLQIEYNPGDEEDYKRELAELKSCMNKSGGQ
jgi:hypothetical protein